MFKTILATSVGLAAATSIEKVKLSNLEVRQAFVDEINTKASTWTAAVHPRFANEPIGSFKNLLGVKTNWTQDVLDAQARGEVEEFVPTWSAMGPIPDAFDSATNWPKCAKMINDIRDQSACGCCWAFGGAEAASDRMCISSDAALMFPLSAQDVCFCSSADGCQGGQIDTPWTFIKNQGVVSGGQYQGSGPFGKGMCQDFSLPHCHHHGPVGKDPYPAEGTKGCPTAQSPKCVRNECGADATEKFQKYSFKGAVQSASGEAKIQQMIMEGGPVETAFTVYTDFENYAGGVYKHTSGSVAGGHAVKFVGWGVDSGTKYWKVANSWNPYWGEDGYFRIIRGDQQGNGGIEGQVTGSSADAKWAKKGPFDY